MSSAIFCRTKKFPASTSRLDIPTPNIPAQNWISKTHIDCVGRDFDIWFDDEKVMERGKISGLSDGTGDSIAVQR